MKLKRIQLENNICRTHKRNLKKFDLIFVFEYECEFKDNSQDIAAIEEALNGRLYKTDIDNNIVKYHIETSFNTANEYEDNKRNLYEMVIKLKKFINPLELLECLEKMWNEETSECNDSKCIEYKTFKNLYKKWYRCLETIVLENITNEEKLLFESSKL